jgi:hypothetical protein
MIFIEVGLISERHSKAAWTARATSKRQQICPGACSCGPWLSGSPMDNYLWSPIRLSAVAHGVTIWLWLATARGWEVGFNLQQTAALPSDRHILCGTCWSAIPGKRLDRTEHFWKWRWGFGRGSAASELPQSIGRRSRHTCVLRVPCQLSIPGISVERLPFSVCIRDISGRSAESRCRRNKVRRIPSPAWLRPGKLVS